MLLDKKKFKKMLPERFVYAYECLRKFPKYLLTKIKLRKLAIPNVKFMDDSTTVNKIVDQGMSLSRFGDGEIMWMSGEKLGWFQEYSEEFAEDLRKAFQSKNSNLLIGIPYGIFDSKQCNLYAKMYWGIIKHDFLTKILRYIDFDRIYCNASITRPYIDYKKREYSDNAFRNLKRIWDKRHIVIIEGERTKLGMGNDLFNNTLSIRRIICPSENAYAKLAEIKTTIRKHVSKDIMMLGALGPTASILAAQLAEEGYQFIDIGHVDVEYMWYLNKSIIRVPIEGKHVNESGEKQCSNYYDYDKMYLDSIIEKIV